MSVRKQRAETVAVLRQQGMPWRQIADRLGISRSYASALGTDPERRKELLRRERYGGACLGCGKKTDGSNGYRGAPSYCISCHARLVATHWTPKRIIEAAQDWAREHGRPPTATEWLRATADHPANSTVQLKFDSWAEMIEQAGFPRPQMGKKSGDYSPSANAALIDLLNEKGLLTLAEGKQLMAEMRPNLTAQRLVTGVHNALAWACKMGYAQRLNSRPASWRATYRPRRKSGRPRK